MAKLDDDCPVLFNGLFEVSVLLPVVFLLDLLNGLLQFAELGLKGLKIIKEQPHIVGEFFFVPTSSSSY